MTTLLEKLASARSSHESTPDGVSLMDVYSMACFDLVTFYGRTVFHQEQDNFETVPGRFWKKVGLLDSKTSLEDAIAERDEAYSK